MLRGRTLRYYVARRFMAAIAGTFLLCALLIFMIDVVDLLRQSGKFGSVAARRLLWMAVLRLPAYTETLMSFSVLVGSIVALLTLSRRSELTVMRAAGMSAWQFLRPGLTVTFVLGLFAVLVYNPIAAAARAEAERLFAEAFGREASLVKFEGSTAWLRQDGADGPSVVNAGAIANQGMSLAGVMILQFDPSGRFVERVDGSKAQLHAGYWEITQAVVSRSGEAAQFYPTYTVSTYLTPERVSDAIGSVTAVSVWQLPGLIEVAEKAKLSAARYRVQYELLLSRPLLLVAMVLLAATVSLRSFRSGRIQTMVVTGVLGGLGFFLLSEVSRQIGAAGLASPRLAVWVPVLMACFLAATVLLHQEDG